MPRQVLNALRAGRGKGQSKNGDEDVWGNIAPCPAPTPGWSLPSTPAVRSGEQQPRPMPSPLHKSGDTNFLISPALPLSASARSVSSGSSGPRTPSRTPNKWWRKRGQTPYQKQEKSTAGARLYALYGEAAGGDAAIQNSSQACSPRVSDVSPHSRHLDSQKRVCTLPGSDEQFVARSNQKSSRDQQTVDQTCTLAKSCWTKHAKVVRLRRRNSTLEADFTTNERSSFQAYQDDMERMIADAESPDSPKRTPSRIRASHHPAERHTVAWEGGNQDEEPEPEWSPMLAKQYQKQFNVPMDQITSARDIFDRYDLTGDGKLDVEEFELLLRSMLKEQYTNVKEMPRELFARVITRADASADGQVDFAEFLLWYTQHAFLEKMLMPPAQQKVRSLARNWKIPLVVVETIHKEFCRYDIDQSGSIEFEEFKNLIYTLLKIPAGLDLPKSRVLAFWQEIDIDGSGFVDFEEFLSWYRRYFDVHGGGNMVSPIEQFYASIRGGKAGFHQDGH